jgi:hypothetical protein
MGCGVGDPPNANKVKKNKHLLYNVHIFSIITIFHVWSGNLREENLLYKVNFFRNNSLHGEQKWCIVFLLSIRHCLNYGVYRVYLFHKVLIPPPFL